ncbi:unnamed protein product [Parajaminaea phylloscopi]
MVTGVVITLGQDVLGLQKVQAQELTVDQMLDRLVEMASEPWKVSRAVSDSIRRSDPISDGKTSKMSCTRLRDEPPRVYGPRPKKTSVYFAQRKYDSAVKQICEAARKKASELKIEDMPLVNCPGHESLYCWMFQEDWHAIPRELWRSYCSQVMQLEHVRLGRRSRLSATEDNRAAIARDGGKRRPRVQELVEKVLDLKKLSNGIARDVKANDLHPSFAEALDDMGFSIIRGPLPSPKLPRSGDGRASAWVSWRLEFVKVPTVDINEDSPT